MIRFATMLGGLSILMTVGCAVLPPAEPMVVKRNLPLSAKGGIDMGGLAAQADPPNRRDQSFSLRGTVRFWNVERAKLDERMPVGAGGAVARVLALESSQRLCGVLDEITTPEDRGRSGLLVPMSGTASVEFIRQVAYLSRWEIALTEHSMAADPSVDVARFGARVTLKSNAEVIATDGCVSHSVQLTIEIAEPNGEIRREPLALGASSEAMIEIPLSTRLTLDVADTLGTDEALLIAAPDLMDLDRGIVILLDVAPTP